MERLARSGGPIDEHLRFQERQWRAARVLWPVLLALMLAALLGVFGNGPLSSTHAATAAVQVDYDRVVRFGAPGRFTVRLQPDAAGLGRVVVGRSLLQAFLVTDITPPPAGAVFVDGGVAYLFRANPGADIVARFETLPIGLLMVEGSIGTPGSTVSLRQLILP